MILALLIAAIGAYPWGGYDEFIDEASIVGLLLRSCFVCVQVFLFVAGFFERGGNVFESLSIASAMVVATGYVILFSPGMLSHLVCEVARRDGNISIVELLQVNAR